MSKAHRSLCVSFSRTGTGLCIYHLFVWSKLNFLLISQWITLPTQTCLVFNSFCASLVHSLIMGLMVSSLSLHSLHLLFSCVLSILALIWLVLMALFCVTVKRDSVSLLKFPFLSHVHVLSSEMFFISRLKRPKSCFPSHFCFIVIVILLSIVLSVSFLMAVMSPPSWYVYSLWVVVSMRQRCLQCCQVLFFPLFLKHIVCQRRLLDIRMSLVFLFFGPFVWVHLWSTWERVRDI